MGTLALVGKPYTGIAVHIPCRGASRDDSFLNDRRAYSGTSPDGLAGSAVDMDPQERIAGLILHCTFEEISSLECAIIPV